MAVVAQFECLSLVEKSAVSLDNVEEDYVLDIAEQSGDGNYIAATSSSHTIRLFSSNNLASVGVITGHTDVISGVSWGKSEPSLLYSSSKDKSVRDRRGSDLLGAYSESHQDDITQVCFHPLHTDSLVSGSTDGLACLFDISETDEDDALSYTWNTCSTVAKVGWCGENWRNVYSTTHMDTFYVWDSVEGDPVVDVTDLKDVLEGTDKVDYIVDCLASENSDLHLLAGTHSGKLKIIELSGKGTHKVTCSMAGGHSTTVRCLYWNSKSNTLITGGEDSMLCLWSTKQNHQQAVISNKAKLKSKKPVVRRSNPY